MKKILVIEDHAQTRNLFLECLKAEGFYPIGAENGLIGLKKVQENLPNLIICDIMIPEVDGYGVLSVLRQNTDTAITPFIFVTAKATRADFRKAMEMGANDYLTKPCTLEELLRAIAAQLEKQAVIAKLCAATSEQVSALSPANTAEPAKPLIYPSHSHLSKVFDFIEVNYRQPISASDVAQAVGYSPAYLTDLMRRQTGQPMHKWIVKRRMVAACSLLLETDQSIEQIAEAVGYRYAGCFFRQFRQSFGMTPQAWRNAQRT